MDWASTQLYFEMVTHFWQICEEQIPLIVKDHMSEESSLALPITWKLVLHSSETVYFLQ